MLTHQSPPRVLLSDVEYLTLKIAFNPGCSERWLLEQLRKYAGGAAAGLAYDFIGGQLVKFSPGRTVAPYSVRLAQEVPTSAIKQEHLKGVPSSDNIRGYVITNAGLDIARAAAMKVGIDPDTIPL